MAMSSQNFLSEAAALVTSSVASHWSLQVPRKATLGSEPETQRGSAHEPSSGLHFQSSRPFLRVAGFRAIPCGERAEEKLGCAGGRTIHLESLPYSQKANSQ